jgi:VTC domain
MRGINSRQQKVSNVLNMKPPDHEIKFIVENSKSYQLIDWLKKNCMPDPEFPVGTVSSIYYDTRNWEYLMEKFNSTYLKSKMRLRWYSDLSYKDHFDATFAEAKFKLGARREKIRLRTLYKGRELANIPLENRMLLEIPKLLGAKGFVPKEQLFPVFQISYKRFRFIDSMTRARICFDYDIHSPRTNHFMLSRVNPFKIQKAVFEIKGSEDELPPSLYPLTDMGCKKSAFSKYSSCYLKIMRNHL